MEDGNLYRKSDLARILNINTDKFNSYLSRGRKRVAHLLETAWQNLGEVRYLTEGKIRLRFTRAFLCPRDMDEQEYEDYLRAIDGLDERTVEHTPERLRDDYGYVVPGCYITIPPRMDDF